VTPSTLLLEIPATKRQQGIEGAAPACRALVLQLQYCLVMTWCGLPAPATCVHAAAACRGCRTELGSNMQQAGSSQYSCSAVSNAVCCSQHERCTAVRPGGMAHGGLATPGHSSASSLSREAGYKLRCAHGKSSVLKQ
jgi:hypothetical protein